MAGAAVLAAMLLPIGADAQDTPLRVSILRHQFQAVVSSDGGLVVRDAGASPRASYVAPDVTTVIDVRPSPSGLLLAGAIAAGSPLAISPAGNFPLAVDGRTYRGSVILQRDGDGTLDVINVVGMEGYLYGVVASEMDPDWPAAALQAQAIVARTYAVAHLGTREWLGYDLLAGEQDQAYQGLQAETAAVVAAVNATRGEILVYGTDVVHAYYSSCDGGVTSDGRALTDPQPYLRSVTDPYCTLSADDRWTVDVPAADVAVALRGRGHDVGAITGIESGSRDDSGRLQWVLVHGTLGDHRLAATEFRAIAGNHLVRSTRISTLVLRHGTIVVSGYGFGHGVGMSQWGARTMALEGMSASDILHFYYRGAQLTQIADDPQSAQ